MTCWGFFLFLYVAGLAGWWGWYGSYICLDGRWLGELDGRQGEYKEGHMNGTDFNAFFFLKKTKTGLVDRLDCEKWLR